ncbi:hypothetical protein [Calidifontibacillus erzurumensis]|uniref:Uncharacterized protein n=1 Tax=Calidifontibacillus erzurumensis TaxID=2741433 RepID=A0A8J8KBT6_9BACI|nr:hypothetical protein [Calidifontibacillus erzurumensis]NSL52284.1 hypothetical protein [Calidifontibacillus erzurumensis]
MTYIIEDANVVSDDGICVRSFLIIENKISHFGKSLKKYQGKRVNVSNYFMTPGHVMADFNILQCDNFINYKKHLVKLIDKGCTTVVVPCYIRYESEFEKKIRAARHAMINSTIDFIIGVHMAAEKLSPQTIRLCKRHKLPYIIIDIEDKTNIFSIPWGWIREAQFQYQVPIYPKWNTKDKQLLKQQMNEWEQMTANHQIPTCLYFPFDDHPRPLQRLIRKQIGIYPKKGELLIGNDLDYNLYQYPLDGEKVEESSKFNYDNNDPIITVHKGKLLKENGKVNFFPGYGQELKLTMPGLFASIDHVGNNPHL